MIIMVMIITVIIVMIIINSLYFRSGFSILSQFELTTIVI